MTTSARVLICGDRDWFDENAIRRELLALQKEWPDVAICHGGARGADRIAGEEAKKLGIPVTEFPANWALYGKRAGPIRNRQMLTEFRPTMVIAFHDDLDASKGTRDMVRAARENMVPTFVRSHPFEAVGRTEPPLGALKEAQDVSPDPGMPFRRRA